MATVSHRLYGAGARCVHYCREHSGAWLLSRPQHVEQWIGWILSRYSMWGLYAYEAQIPFVRRSLWHIYSDSVSDMPSGGAWPAPLSLTDRLCI